jgi:hypothetical protein
MRAKRGRHDDAPDSADDYPIVDYDKDDDDLDSWERNPEKARDVTIWTALRDGDARNLRRCIHFKGADVNVLHPKLRVSPLAMAVANGLVECARVLIDAGANGAIDALRSIGARVNFVDREWRSVLVLGCTRDELRTWETELSERPWHPEKPLGSSNAMDFVNANAVMHLKAWIGLTGMDSIRTPGKQGWSLEEVAADLGYSEIARFLKARKIFTFLMCNRFGARHDSSHPIVRMPRDLAVLIARTYLYTVPQCMICHKEYPAGRSISCSQCIATEVPCPECRASLTKVSAMEAILHPHTVTWAPCACCRRPVCASFDCRAKCKGHAYNAEGDRSFCSAILCKECEIAKEGSCPECRDQSFTSMHSEEEQSSESSWSAH